MTTKAANAATIRSRLLAFAEGRHGAVRKFASDFDPSRWDVERSEKTGKPIVYDRQSGNKPIYGKQAQQIIDNMGKSGFKQGADAESKASTSAERHQPPKFLDQVDVQPNDSPETQKEASTLAQTQKQYLAAIEQYKARDASDPAEQQKWHKYASDLARKAQYTYAKIGAMRQGMQPDQAHGKFKGILPAYDPVAPGPTKLIPAAAAQAARKAGILPPHHKVDPLKHYAVRHPKTGRLLGWKPRTKPLPSFNDKINEAQAKPVEGIVPKAFDWSLGINSNVGKAVQNDTNVIGRVAGDYATQFASWAPRLAAAAPQLAINTAYAPLHLLANGAKRLGGATAEEAPLNPIAWDEITARDKWVRDLVSKGGAFLGKGVGHVASAIGKQIGGGAVGLANAVAHPTTPLQSFKSGYKGTGNFLDKLNKGTINSLGKIGFAEQTRQRLRAFHEGQHQVIHRFRAEWTRVESKRAKHGFVMVSTNGTRVAGDRALQIAQRQTAGPTPRGPRAKKAASPRITDKSPRIPDKIPDNEPVAQTASVPAPQSPPVKLSRWARMRAKFAAGRAKAGEKFRAAKANAGAKLKAGLAKTKAKAKAGAKGAAKWSAHQAAGALFPPEEKEAMYAAWAKGDKAEAVRQGAIGAGKFAWNLGAGMILGVNFAKTQELRKKYGVVPALAASIANVGLSQIRNAAIAGGALLASTVPVAGPYLAGSLGIGGVAGSVAYNPLAWWLSEHGVAKPLANIPKAIAWNHARASAKRHPKLKDAPRALKDRYRTAVAHQVKGVFANSRLAKVINAAYDYPVAGIVGTRRYTGKALAMAPVVAWKGAKKAGKFVAKTAKNTAKAIGGSMKRDPKDDGRWLGFAEALDRPSSILLNTSHLPALRLLGSLLRSQARLHQFSEQPHISTTIKAALALHELSNRMIPLQACRVAVQHTFSRALALAA